MKRSVTVTIAGHRLAIRTDADDKYVQELVGFVERRVAELKRSSKGATTESVALLAALQVADELFRERQDRKELGQIVREKSRSILDYIRREVRL